MSPRGVAIVVVVVVVAGTIGAGGVLIGQKSKKTKSRPSAKTTAPKPPSLVPTCTLAVDGTLSVETTGFDTTITWELTLTDVTATRRAAEPQGAYAGSGVKGTFTASGRQVTLNTRSTLEGKVTGGSISFDLADNGFGVLSGSGTLTLKCKITGGTATNKYGSTPMPRSVETLKIPVKVTVEGSEATVKATGGYGNLMGTFSAPGL